MKDPKKRVLTAQQVCDLLAKGRFERVEALSMPIAGMAFYKDDRGGALLIQSKTKKPGVYFDSYDEYVAFEQALASSEPHHMLWRMLPEGERFPETIPAKLDELAHALGLPREALDFSHKSFARLDRVVARDPHRYLEADRFPLLVAYAGEAIRHRKGGRWEMVLYHDGETWQPEIVLPDGTRRSPYVSLYKGLLEWGGRGTLSGTLEALAEVWQLKAGPPATEGS